MIIIIIIIISSRKKQKALFVERDRKGKKGRAAEKEQFFSFRWCARAVTATGGAALSIPEEESLKRTNLSLVSCYYIYDVMWWSMTETAALPRPRSAQLELFTASDRNRKNQRTKTSDEWIMRCPLSLIQPSDAKCANQFILSEFINRPHNW